MTNRLEPLPDSETLLRCGCLRKVQSTFVRCNKRTYKQFMYHTAYAKRTQARCEDHTPAEFRAFEEDLPLAQA